jgi:hypothetical protein
MGDACMGLTRLRKAGRASTFRKPQREGIFTPRSTVRAALEADEKIVEDASAAVECNDHAAAKSAASATARRQKYYDRKGIAVLVCRHEQVRLRHARMACVRATGTGCETLICDYFARRCSLESSWSLTRTTPTTA